MPWTRPAEGGWTGGLLVANAEELKNNSASEVHVIHILMCWRFSGMNRSWSESSYLQPWSGLDSRESPDDIWPEVWSKMPQNFQRQAKQPWDTDKQTQGRRCTPSDRHLLHFVGWWKNLTPWSKNARRKLESHMESAMCKAQRKSDKKWIILCQPAGWNRVQKHSWWKPHEPKKKSQVPLLMFTKWMLMNLDAISKNWGKQRHEEHIAARGYNSMSPYKLVHLPIPFPKEMKNLEGKAAVDKEWGNLTNVPA